MALKKNPPPRKSTDKTGSANPPVDQRTAIIVAAIALFGQLGFEGTTTRMIAKQAKVNLGLIQYYFGGKEQLYMGCADYIVDLVRPRLDALMEKLHSDFNACRTREQYVLCLRQRWRIVAEVLLSKDGPRTALMFISREQLSPSKAFRVLQKNVVERLMEIFQQPLAQILGCPAESEEVVISAAGLLGPIFIVQRAPTVLLSPLRWKDLEGVRLKKVLDILCEQTLYGVERGELTKRRCVSIKMRHTA